MSEEYDDILFLPRPVFKTRPRMAAIDRAAQFSPFAALTGYDSAVKETARLTEERMMPDESMQEELRRRLQIIEDRKKERSKVSITYFRPDERKEGGAYLTVVGTVKRIDEEKRVILLTNGKEIPLDELFDIEGEIFEDRQEA